MLARGIVWNQFTIGVLRRLLNNGVVLGVGIVLALSVSLFSVRFVTAANSDCDANAVIYCGVSSTEGLVSRYNNGDGRNSAGSIQHIFSWFGISSNEVSALGSTARNGTITSDGNVHLDGKIVATNAMTGGRQNMSGSTAQTQNGTTFYTRPPSVSFASSPLEAYVVMKNGVFQYAIIKSCGNPVKANPKTQPPAPQPKPAPTPAPKPAPAPAPAPVPQPPPPPAPANVCSGNTTNTATNSAAAQGGNCSTNTTTVNQQAAPAPPPPPPSGQCISVAVQASRDNPLEVAASVSFQALNGARLQSVSYNFGDQTAPVSVTDSSFRATHIYAQAGTYNITATLAFTDGTSTNSTTGSNSSGTGSSSAGSNSTGASSTGSNSMTDTNSTTGSNSSTTGSNSTGTNTQPVASVTCQASITVTQPPAPAAPTTPPPAPQVPVVTTGTTPPAAQETPAPATPVVTTGSTPAPVQQEAPTTLVSTGAKELGLAGAFISTMLAGILSYRLFLLHRMQ